MLSKAMQNVCPKLVLVVMVRHSKAPRPAFVVVAEYPFDVLHCKLVFVLDAGSLVHQVS